MDLSRTRQLVVAGVALDRVAVAFAGAAIVPE